MKKKYTREMLLIAIGMFKEGVSVSKIARKLDIPVATVDYWINRERINALHTKYRKERKLAMIEQEKARVNSKRNGLIVVGGALVLFWGVVIYYVLIK